MRLWIDLEPRAAAGQMAVDEALFLDARDHQSSWLRIYQWVNPSVTIGYFDKFPQIESRPVIRRITGGGLVEHGEDLTFCLVLPTDSSGSRMSTERRYQLIHEALFQALKNAGLDILLGDQSRTHAKGACFENPVRWDLLNSTGQKIVGGAQRNSRGVVIHQGSAQLPQEYRVGGRLFNQWIEDFGGLISDQITTVSADELPISIGSKFADLESKYENESWNIHARGTSK